MNLNELILTIAITGGVLTVGVPQFQVYQQKAKQVEAKLGLGALYKAQEGFVAEHNAYGSNLERMGFVIEGNANERIYTIGFPTSDCRESEVKPSLTSSAGKRIESVFPDYYVRISTLSARIGQAHCYEGVVENSGVSYTASASGPIAPDLSTDAPLAQQDVWTINEKRQLLNIQDGVVVPQNE